MSTDGRSRMQLLAHMINFDQDLKGIDPGVLDRLWHFVYCPDQSPERNVYEFFDQLEQWRSYCRRWHVNNSSRTLTENLDQIREQHMLPKIRDFLAELAQHTDK